MISLIRGIQNMTPTDSETQRTDLQFGRGSGVSDCGVGEDS